MTDRYTEEEVIAAIALLSRSRLTSFVETQVVVPLHTDKGPMYRDIDLARLELLCELSEHFDLNEDALEIVISLVDQLHGVRCRLRAMARAIEAEPPEVRTRIAEALSRIGSPD